ncbi:MAG TPA: SDR family NAD(P)-dependent oxidoreductase [Candidatus Saccharimonadales bacterium]|nr:SDR family NAD(P)-dependent oxidoreductase [Candidatus Saccharimonadales bacterium]
MSDSKTIIVTGVNGFVGHHLSRKLHELGHKVIGVGYDAAPTDRNKDSIDQYVKCDMTKASDVQALDLTKVDGVIHLAGLANVGMSFDKPAEFISSNTAMVINLLQHAMEQKSEANFVVISSGAVYDGKQPMPITEDEGVLTHNSPYAISKLATEYLTEYYASRGIKCVITRPFNHVGPGQGPGFLVPDLAFQLQKVKSGEISEVIVGNLDTKRDYTDARDVVDAYIAIATSQNAPKERIYNVCSGTSRSGREILDLLIKSFKFDTPPKITVDEKKLRPNDPQDIRGSSDRLRNEYNWKPTIPLDQTISDFVAGLNQ